MFNLSLPSAFTPYILAALQDTGLDEVAVNLIVTLTGYLFKDCALKFVQVVRIRVSVFKGIGQPSTAWHHDMLHRDGLHLHVQVLTALNFRGVEGYVDHTSCSFLSNVPSLCATVC